MSTEQRRGKLVIIGGAEDRRDDCLILREFLRCAGGLKARIAILTAATSEPWEAGDTYIEVFERLGVEAVTVVDTRDRDEAETIDALNAIAEATGVFFTGGDQSRIIDTIKGTLLEDILHKRHAEGMVVAGTSAGAAAIPDVMIIEGDSRTHARLDTVDMGEGLGFRSQIIVDQHFAQRGRLGRLLAATLQHPTALGLGIDEDTALIIEDSKAHVVGSGAVTIVDESETTYSNLDRVLKDEAFAVCGVKLHVLPAGHGFDLETRSHWEMGEL
ncbi:MAG: cyanophycinase [Leptolyngbya sp. SIO4C1]|nr:cyanophycinase [Leptolyngbya sp. SIO4C1]